MKVRIVKFGEGAVIVNSPEWSIYEKISHQPEVDLEKWK